MTDRNPEGNETHTPIVWLDFVDGFPGTSRAAAAAADWDLYDENGMIPTRMLWNPHACPSLRCVSLPTKGDQL